MAQGTIKLFDEYAKSIGDGRIPSLSFGAPYKMAFISIPITGSEPNPCWGGGGTTDLSASEVSTAGTEYYSGGYSLTNLTLTRVGGTTTVDAYDFSGTYLIERDLAGPMNIRTAIIYWPAGTKCCVAFIDMTIDGGVTPISLRDGSISIYWPSNGIIRTTVNP